MKKHRFGIKNKLLLQIIPLILIINLAAGYIHFREAGTALLRLANRHLAYKAEELRDFIYNEWNIIESLELSSLPEYQTAMVKSVQSYASSLLRNESEHILVFGRDGELLFDASLAPAPDAVAEIYDELREELSDEGWIEFNLDGIERIGVVFTFGPLEWPFVVSDLHSVFFHELDIMQRNQLLTLLISMLLSFVLITFYVKIMLRPVELLDDRMEDIISSGDLGSSVPVVSMDEIGALSERFNLMLRTINEGQNLLEEKRRDERRARQKAEAHEKEALNLLGKVSDIRDEETGLHLKRIGELSKLLGRLSGLDEEQQELLLNSSPLHDIGKIGIPEAILLKPAKLTPEEFSTVQKHTVIGHNLLKDSKSIYLRKGAEIALTHHEKWDGNGYPEGTKEAEIPLFGRIVSIVDVIDALLTERPYKKAWSPEQVLSYIREQRARHFDPKLVDVVCGNFDTILVKYS